MIVFETLPAKNGTASNRAGTIRYLWRAQHCKLIIKQVAATIESSDKFAAPLTTSTCLEQ